MNSDSKCKCCDAKAAAVLLGRWILGVLFLFAGLGKLPDLAGFAGYLLDTFKDTWLPGWLLSLYARGLPFLEVTLGGLLIFGVLRNPVLLAAGLLLLSLALGQILLKQYDVVSHNLIYAAIAAAVLFLEEHDRWALLKCCPCRRGNAGSKQATAISPSPDAR